MAAGYDGSITIDTRIDSRGFNTGMKALMGTLGKFAGVVGVAFGIRAIVKFGQTAVNEASSLASALVGLESVIKGQGRSFSDAQGFIEDYIADGLVPAKNAITAYKNLAMRGYDTSQIQQTLTILKDTAAFGRQSSYSMGEAVQSATEGLKNENSILVDNAGVTKNVAKMWQDYAKSIGTTVGALTKEQKIEAEVQGLRQESIYQTGDAAKMTNTYAGQLASLGAAFTSLKVAVGNVFMPILQKIIPIIIQVVNWLTMLATRAAQVIQMLLGIKVTASGYEEMAAGAEAAADATGDLAGATEGAGKAAKGALAPFDELNVLQQDSGGEGSGGGTGGGLGGLEIEEGESPFDALGDSMDGIKEKLIALFEPAAEPFARFKEQVLELGGKIWDGLVWVWNNILVPIGEWAITEALPVFLDLLAAALDVINNTLDALKPLGEWLWENFLKPLGEWVGGAILDVLGWLVEKLTNLATWIENNQKLVQEIVAVLGAFYAIILIINVVMAIYTAVTSAAAAAQFALMWPIYLIIAAIVALIAIVIAIVHYWPEISAAATAAWEWIKQAWQDAGAWFGEIWDAIVGWFVGAWETIKGWATAAWEWYVGIWVGAANWFNDNVLQPLINFFKPIWEFIAILAHNAWALIQYAWEVASAWFNEHVIQPLVTFFTKLWDDIKQLFTTLWDAVVAVWTVVATWFNTNVIEPVVDFFTGLWEKVSGAASDTWDAIKGVWEAVSSWWEEHVTGPLSEAWTKFTEWISEKWNSLWDAVGTYLKGILNGVIDMLNGFLSFVFGGINKLISWINRLGSVVPKWIDIPEITVPQIPRLATGAVIPANAPFAAILGDQRSGRNIETPEALMRQIVREEMAGMGGGKQDITINFAGSFGALIREMKPYIDKENVRVGRSMVRGGA